MTKIKIAKILQAITETKNALTRATNYAPDLQDKPIIEFYKKHIITLENMLLG